MAKDAIKIVAEITKVFSNTDYEVLLENGITIKAFASGKMAFHHIKMIPGDKVDVELSPYDMTKGRIVKRYDSSKPTVENETPSTGNNNNNTRRR